MQIKFELDGANSMKYIDSSNNVKFSSNIMSDNTSYLDDLSS